MRYFLTFSIFIIFSAQSFAAQWHCQDSGGWMLNTQGGTLQLPAEPNDIYAIAFSPPNKMQILQSSDPLDAQIYPYLNWVKIGNTFHGTGIYTMDGGTFNVTESIDDTKAISAAVVSGHPEIIAAIGVSSCRRIK